MARSIFSGLDEMLVHSMFTPQVPIYTRELKIGTVSARYLSLEHDRSALDRFQTRADGPESTY